MSLIESITTLLTPVVGNKLFWDVTPDNGPGTTAGFIVAQEMGGKAGWYVEKKLPDHKHARLQLQIFHPRKLDADTLTKLVEKTICESDLVAEPYGAAVATYDETLKIYGYRQHFGIWYPDP